MNALEGSYKKCKHTASKLKDEFEASQEKERKLKSAIERKAVEVCMLMNPTITGGTKPVNLREVTKLPFIHGDFSTVAHTMSKTNGSLHPNAELHLYTWTWV